MLEINVESAKSSLRVAVANAAAEGIISGFDEAAEMGRPLTELQRTDITKMVMMAVASTINEHEHTLDFEAVLNETAKIVREKTKE